MCSTVARFAAALGTLVFTTCLATAQTLVVNGDFDTDVAGWTELSIPLSWSPSDCQGDPTSGSASTLNNAPYQANSGTIQCVDDIVVGETYHLSAWLRVPTGQTGTGATTVFVWWYTEPGCTGTMLPQDLTTPTVWTSDTWVEVTAAPVAAPATTQSARVYLNCHKQSATGTYESFFDHVVFRPVSNIFADGFDDGSTGAWSLTVP